MPSYVITDKETWGGNKPGSEQVYVWKVGNSPLRRLHPHQSEAAQGLLDYLVGAWKQVSSGVEVLPSDFVILQYDGPLTEAELDKGGQIGRVLRTDLSYVGEAGGIIMELGLQPNALVMDSSSGFAAVKKEDYNGGKMAGGSQDIVLWCTGDSGERRRIYDSLDEAKEGLAAYIKQDWDGVVAEQELMYTDFVIVEVKSPSGAYQIYTKSDQVMLAAIVSVPKSFTEDDALF